jgi:cell division septation protein DedD
VARFFFGAAVGGRLRLRDIPDWGYWNAKGIVYWDEAHIDGVSRLTLIGRKIWSAGELDEAIAASFDLPGVEAVWIHESMLGEARRRWKESRRTVKNRLEARAPAAAAVVIAAACLAGLAAAGHRPELRAHFAQPPLVGRAAPHSRAEAAHTPLLPRGHESVQTGMPPAVALRAASQRIAVRAAARPASRLTKAAYAVTVGTFVSAERADRVKHLVQSKGYIVHVVAIGAFSQVVTPPYRNRTHAEQIARGLVAAGLPAQLTSWRGL